MQVRCWGAPLGRQLCGEATMTRVHLDWRYRDFVRSILNFGSGQSYPLLILLSEDLETFASAVTRLLLVGSGSKPCNRFRERKDICSCPARHLGSGSSPVTGPSENPGSSLGGRPTLVRRFPSNSALVRVLFFALAAGRRFSVRNQNSRTKFGLYSSYLPLPGTIVWWIYHWFGVCYFLIDFLLYATGLWNSRSEPVLDYWKKNDLSLWA